MGIEDPAHEIDIHRIIGHNERVESVAYGVLEYRKRKLLVTCSGTRVQPKGKGAKSLLAQNFFTFL